MSKFVARLGIIALNDSTISGSLVVTNGVTGSLSGTSSWASSAVSSSYAISASAAVSAASATSASYALNATNAVNATSATSASYAVSASAAVSAASATSASYSISSSAAVSAASATSASYALNSTNATSATSATSASYALNSTNAVNATNAINATSALTASSADTFTVRGTLTAQTLVVQTITSSIDFVTGSTRFGSVVGNTHQFTGSVSISGSLSVNGVSAVTGTGNTNYLPKFTGTSALGNSQIIDDGTSVNIGGVVSSVRTLTVGKDLTGNAAMGITSNGLVKSTTTTSATYFRSTATAEAGVSILNLNHFWAAQGSVSTAVITNQYGFRVNSGLTGATNNYGFYGDIASGTGRWNLYMNGTALNYMNGALLIGTTTDNGARLQVAGKITSTAGGTDGGEIRLANSGGGSTWYWAARTTGLNLGELAAADGRIFIANGGNVGIGTNNPSNKLSVREEGAGGIAVIDVRGGASGGAGAIAISGNGTTIISTSFDLIQNSGGAYVLHRDNNPLILGINNTERMRITSGGEVYIAGTTDQGAYNLQCNGTGVWGAGAYVNGSDVRLKENITDIDEGLSLVEKMKPVSFNYKIGYSQDRSVQTGFIAQDLLEVFKDKNYLEGLVQQGPTYYNVAYQNIIPILVKAIQELKAEIGQLKAAQ